ncbi:WD repeat-containing protein 75 [Periplaneta americana]|uniref:WD repeat-containing protein 75 n=1 Tax=Periplaneta americana TaxID=6978 RepID=UPI0037E932A5
MKAAEERLVLMRRGGGSLINFCPVFSSDGELIFVVCGPVVRAYGVRTGELVSEYDGLESKAVGVRLHPTDTSSIVACSVNGQLIQWDWRSRLKSEIVKLKLKKETIATNFYMFPPVLNDTAENCRIFLVWKYLKGNTCHMSLFCSSSGSLLQKLEFELDNVPSSIAFGGPAGSEYIAGIYRNRLQFANTVKWEQCGIKEIRGRYFTCVACHPEELCIATGDNTGRVLIWWNFSFKKSTYAVYHWHTLPVQAVTFSQAGSQFYSGGGECVLVRWTLDSLSDRNFLPRLPSSVCHLSVAPDNKYLALCTSDNGIQIVTPQLKLVSTVQHFTWCVEMKHGLDPFPAGITFDPQNKAMVLNGRTGYIQFYSPRTKSLLYNLDITGLNYLTQERNAVIVNTDVTKVAFSSNGQWMSTVEQRDDGETNMEVRLKFWFFDSVKQNFSLNTSVELPQSGGIVALAFQCSSDPQQQLAATAGADFKFRIWTLAESSSIYKKGIMVWRCESVGFFRNLPCGDLSFSSDGSLLAVTFGPTLTLWVPETNQLKCSLTDKDAEMNLSCVKFGLVDSCHLVVTGSSKSINVWNLLTLTLAWTVPLHVSLLVADPSSEFMAAFTYDRDLFVFSPRKSEPVYVHREVLDNSILCAAFIPHFGLERSANVSWQQQSQLYILDSNQELLTLDKPGEDSAIKEGITLPVSSVQTTSLFGTVLAKQSKSDVEKLLVDTTQQLGVPGAAAIKQLLKAPAHTMPPINLLCGPFLQSFVATSRKQEEKKNMVKQEPEEETRMETEDSGVDSEDEVSGVDEIKQKKTNIKGSEAEVNDSTRTKSVDDLDANLASVLKEDLDWTELLVE